MVSLTKYTTSLWRFVIYIATAILLLGAAVLPFNYSFGLAAIGAALGFTAVAMAFIAETLIGQIRSNEVEEKIAMMKAYSGDEGARIISDLEALESFSNSISKAQAQKIADSGPALLVYMQAKYPNSEDEARAVLNRILKPFKLTV